MPSTLPHEASPELAWNHITSLAMGCPILGSKVVKLLRELASLSCKQGSFDTFGLMVGESGKDRCFGFGRKLNGNGF